MNLDRFVEANSNSKAADVILVPSKGMGNGRKSTGKKRKMNMDADEEDEWNETGSDSGWD